VVAKVNGAPITEAELQREISSHGRQNDRGVEQAKLALESLIREELAYQKALALGLDSDVNYREQVRRLEAEIRSVKRRSLADVYFRTQATKNAEVPENELRAYFDQNAPKLRAELHVWQMLVRSQAKANELAERLKKGESFETVAQSLFPQLPTTDRKPWDLGFLGHSQVPEPWRDVVYALKPGQTSGVVAGPNDRFWILKLVERRDKPDFTFDKARSAIVATLKAQKSEELRTQLNGELKKGANIEYLPRRPQPMSGAPLGPARPASP
jgi:parvulin-like peptidyl-prolyl isomerase